MIYLDTGCLLKLYYPEPESSRVAELVSGEALAFTALHELELTNALELKLYRKEAASAQIRATRSLIQSDQRSGVLHRPNLAWEDVWRDALAFAQSQSRRIGCRSLDVLHCAAACGLNATSFITTDARQRRLAAKIGLSCPIV